jgi:hypothetical protein
MLGLTMTYACMLCGCVVLYTLVLSLYPALTFWVPAKYANYWCGEWHMITRGEGTLSMINPE